MKVEQVGTGIMVDPAKAMTFEESIKNHPTWVAWLEVRKGLKLYGSLPYKNGKGSYTLYKWDRNCEALSKFWKGFTKEDRKECGLTAHMKDDELMIYEMGFAIKARPRKPKAVKPAREVPAYAKEQAKRDAYIKLPLYKLVFKALIGKRLENFKNRLIDSLM